MLQVFGESAAETGECGDVLVGPVGDRIGKHGDSLLANLGEKALSGAGHLQKRGPSVVRVWCAVDVAVTFEAAKVSADRGRIQARTFGQVSGTEWAGRRQLRQ